jgi:hypothetical protein
MEFFSKENLDKYKYVYLGICIILAVIVIYVVVMLKKKEGFEDEDIITTTSNKEYILRYFGSKGCPHSREGSRAYLIVKEFENNSNDVKVIYYWADEENTKDEFMKARAEYVPTLTNAEYKKIELVLPKCKTAKCEEKRKEMNEKGLKELLFKSISEQVKE